MPSDVENMTSARVIEAARAWIGTPFAHHMSKRGQGADCLGLIIGVYEDCYGVFPHAWPEYAPPQSPSPHEHANPRAFASIFATTKRRGASVRLSVFRLARRRFHMGLVFRDDEKDTIVHAKLGAGVTSEALPEALKRRTIFTYNFEAPILWQH